ncbi:hypothetical protein [Paraburkholderia heleia]|uniref:hypothetical protein n=1 Tax=Paraburkholderia heleia TaxID=634127 RepID=UPI002AB76AB4|nr:hypothetical protein [Paraburkholderia heleia]
MLLPLPAHKARALSLEHHIALSVLASGHGGIDQAVRLLQAICHGRFLLRSDETDDGTFDEAEAALDALVTRTNAGGAWVVDDIERAAIAGALALHDQLTAREPYHRFVETWKRMLRFVRERVAAST